MERNFPASGTQLSCISSGAFTSTSPFPGPSSMLGLFFWISYCIIINFSNSLVPLLTFLVNPHICSVVTYEIVFSIHRIRFCFGFHSYCSSNCRSQTHRWKNLIQTNISYIMGSISIISGLLGFWFDKPIKHVSFFTSVLRFSCRTGKWLSENVSSVYVLANSLDISR